MINNLEQVIRFLREGDDFLLLTHEKPDGDAVGSLLGLTEMLRAAGKNATPVLRDELPERYVPLAAPTAFRRTLDDAELSRIERVVVVDCANFNRIAAPFPLEKLLSKTLCCIDHHVDDSIDAPFRFVDPAASATGEIIERLPFPIGQQAADLLYVAILTDTGGFRFSNTTAATFEAAARLRRAGAEHEKIINAVFFTKKRNQQQLESRMILDCEHSEFGGKYLWAYLPDELFREYNFDMRDGDTVIELLRELSETVICALIYRRGDNFKVSLRSKDSRFSVGAIARQFGGGGHEMAAGITVTGMTLDELTSKLSFEIGKYFQ